MSKPGMFFLVCMLFWARCPMMAQRELSARPIPGLLRLLPGYEHQPLQGIDSCVGRIWKSGGVEINYDIGKQAGNYAECQSCGWTKGELWRKNQTVDGQKVVMVFTK